MLWNPSGVLLVDELPVVLGKQIECFLVVSFIGQEAGAGFDEVVVVEVG